MEIIKKLKYLRFLVVLCVANLIMSFLLEPVQGSSDTMWAEYYKEDEIDFAFVGASFCQTTFAPYVIDELLGVKSFNMGTPLQAVGQTVSSVETLLDEHEVDTVVVGMGFFILQYETLDEAELTFEKARVRKKSGWDAVVATLEYVLDEDVWNTEKSINFFFPWVYNHEKITTKYIENNVAKKVEKWKEWKTGVNGDSIEESAKGFRPSQEVADYNAAWEINSYWYYDQIFLEDKIEEFEKILSLCKDKGVDIIVVNTPHPIFDVVSCYQTYEASEKEMVAICEEYDVDYYNFSLAKPELFASKPEYYSDFEHLNMNGAEAFSEAFCRLLDMRAAGESVEECFYSVEEYYEIHAETVEEWKAIQTPK